MFCVLLIVVYLSLSVLFLIRTEWFKECCGNLWNQWKSLHFSIKSFALIFIAVMTVFAAVKPPAEPTAPPPGTESTPMASEVIIERTFSDSKVNDSSKDISMGDDLLDMNRDFYDSTSNIFTRVVTNTAFVWLNPPTNHVKYARWQNYGVAEDSFWVPATNWAFVYGSNLVDGVYVSSSGTLSFDVPKSSSEAHGLPDGTGIDFLAPFHSSLSIIHSDTNSCFWYAPTDTNSMLFTWSSFYLGRNITNKFSCQVELFYNGDFTYRYYFPTNIVGFTNDFVIGGQYGDEGETYFHNNFSNLVDGLRYTTDVPDPTIDTDGDGIYDIVEIYYGTDPYVANETDDSDHDGISDNDEYYTIDPATGLRLDATNYDSDGDGIPDSSDPEPFIENTTDADNDGLLDVLELVHFDSIDNGVFNTHSGDQNGNGVINRIDLLLGVNPLLSCYAVSSSHDSYVFGWSDVANATSYDVSVKQNDETVWSTNSVTSTFISMFDEEGLFESGEYTLEVIANRSTGGNITGKETFYTIPTKNIISWKIFETFTLEVDSDTGLFEKIFKIEKKNDWQKFYISSSPYSAKGWSMNNLDLSVYTVSEWNSLVSINASPLGDSLFIDVPPNTSEIEIFMHASADGLVSLSYDIYLLRWSPGVTVLGGSGAIETSTDEYAMVSIVGAESTQEELRYIVDTDDLPNKAGLSLSEKDTLRYPLNGASSNSFNITTDTNGIPSVGAIKTDALTGSFSVSLPDSSCNNWNVDPDRYYRLQRIVPPAPLETEVITPPVPSKSIANEKAYVQVQPASELSINNSSLPSRLSLLPPGETPLSFMLHILEPSISIDRGSRSTICSAYLYEYLHDKYPFDSSCLWKGWYEGSCSDEITVDYGKFTLNLKNTTAAEIQDNILEVYTTRSAPELYTSEFKYYWGTDETNTICRLTLGGEEIWSTNVVRASLEDNTYECSGTGGLYVESDECDSCGTCTDGSCSNFDDDSLSSIRFRAMLGFVGDEKLAGLIYFDEKEMPTEITPAIFKIFDKPYVDKIYTGGYLSLIKCDMEGGRNITISSITNEVDGVDEAGVKLEIRNWGDTTIQSTWDITKTSDSVHFVNYNKGSYVIANNSYFYTNGVWSKKNNLKNTVEEIIETGDYQAGLTTENNTYGNNEEIIYSSITDEMYIGNTNTIRTTYASDYGIGGLKSETYSTYWEDNEYFLKNGKLKFSSVYNIVDNDGTHTEAELAQLALGDWQYNIFDDYGRRTLQIRPLNGSTYPSFVNDIQEYNFDDDESQSFTGKVTVKNYQPITGSDDSNHPDDINRPRRIDKYIVNNSVPILISRTWNVYSRETNTYPIVVSYTERASSADSTFDDGDNPTSTSKSYATETNLPSLLRGRPIRQESYDGTLYRWEYEPAGDNYKITSISGTVENPNGIENVSTYDVEIIDATFGHTESSSTYLYTGEENDPIISSAEYTYDSLRRQTVVSYSDGTFTSNYWPCCHLGEITDRSGVHTKNLNDHNNLDYYGQAQISVAELPNTLGNYPVTESFPDAYGFETSSVQRVYNNGSVVTSYEPLTTTTEYIGSISNASAITITTDQIGVQNQDISSNIQMGSVNYSIDGAGVTSMYISVTGGSSTNITTWTDQFANTVWTKTWNTTTYNEDGCRISTSYRQAEPDDIVQTGLVTSISYYDFQGRVVATHTPAPHSILGTLSSSSAYNWSSNFYDSATGHLIRTERSGTTTNDKRTTLYEYNTLGQLKYTAQDVNDNNTIDLEGEDRISGSSSYYEEINNDWYRTSVSYIWAQTNPANCTTTSVSRTQATGLGSSPTVAEFLELGSVASGVDRLDLVQTSLASSEDIHGNVTTNMTFVDQSTATKWQISKSPFSAQPSIQKTIAGYPVMTVNSLGATNTFTYDGFARQISATTTRQASPDIGVIPLGTPSPSSAFVTQVTSNFYNNVGQLSSTVSDQLITNFEYDSIGRTHAVCSRGQQTSENSAITNTYNSLGQLIHQYGSTYPVAYEYDSQGRKTKMTTFADPNDPAETQWLYDEPTGLLTNKLYDDGTGPTYTYYPNGQMCSKTTAEGMIMSNAYNIAGQLISTTYSDGTPTITREYNRLGQLVTVNDAQGTRAFEYCTNTFALLSESINGTNVLMYSYNNRGQQTGYAFGNAEPQLGKIIIFDDYGRQSSISAIFGSETNTFHFNYLYGSSMVSSITNNLGFGVSKYYEDNRNLIVGISNYFGEDCISSFIYDNDALGRRTERLDFDENLLVKTNSFAYNGYQEINEADMGTNEYIFTYDDIGNRTEHLINDVYARYENNNDSLNRYSDTYSTDRVYNKGYDFDADGNMTNAIQYATPWDTWQYTWNAENRMTSARNTQYGIYVTYAYDYQGRMFEKVTNGSTNHFIWNGNHIIAEMTDSTTNSFVWSNGETLTASLDGETIFYCHDANKNVTDLVDDSGDIVVHYEYSPFGVQTTTDEQPLAETNPFGFSNEYFDATTGFIEYKYRIYLPALGKFLSLDPIEEQGGLNLYGIGGNDLINNWDNWGRSKAFYPFSGKIALLNRLAAEEQHVTKVYYSFREAFNASNQTEDWGALFIGSIKDVEMFTGNRGIDANSIVSESGKVYIYAHGSLDGNDIVTGGENIRPADIEWADASHFEPKTLKGIWAFSCYFGNKGGGAQQWHNILDVIVIGHEGLSKVTISPYIKFTDNVRKVDEMQKIYDEFKTLTTKVHSDQISYDSFYNLWEIMFDKWKEKGCIEKAYWHTFHPLGYKYNTYK